MERFYIIYLYFAILVSLSEAIRTRVTWINGIGYNEEHMLVGQKEMAKLFGGKHVSFCHNPTGMSHDNDLLGYVGDLTQAGTQKLGRITAEVDAVVKHLREALVKVGKRGRVIHIAHSQGVLITYLATKQLTPLEMQQIEILAFGGAAALQKNAHTPFHRCVNYYSVNDPLLLLVPEAAQALKSGFVDEQFCFLAPRMGDPVQDHSLLAPTYAQALQWEGTRFQKKYQSIVYRSVRACFLVLMAIWRAILERMIATAGFFVQRLKVVHGKLETALRPLGVLIVLLFQWFKETMSNLLWPEKYQPIPVQHG